MNQTETEVVITPAADDQVRSEDFDLGENVIHAVCQKCYPYAIFRDLSMPMDALCGKHLEGKTPAPGPRCPDCYDQTQKKACPKGHIRP